MKRLLLVLAATTALAGCATTPAMVDSTAGETPAVADAAPAPSRPSPELGTYGFDTSGMNNSVLPGDNYFEYANGTWLRDTPIPADKSGYGMFAKLDDISKQRTRELIEESAKDSNSRIGAVYASFTDQAAIDAKGMKPIEPWLGQIKALNNRGGLPALYAAAARNGVRTPFGAYVGQDDKNPDTYILSLGQSGLGLPDRDYYLKDDAKLTDIRAKYLQHLTNMLTLAGEPNAAARATAILAFETDLARVHWTRVDSRDATKTYNKMTVAALAKSAPGFDFARMIRESGANGVSDLIVAQPSAITGEARILGRAPLGVLRDQLLVRSLSAFASVLPSAVDREQFAFYGTTLNGTPEQEVRWKRAVSFTTGALQDDVSKLYVAKYFPPETKAAADALVKNVVEAMGRRIDGLTWMAPATKQRARAKLANFTTKIGYPDQWRDMSGLQVSRDDAFGNALRANQFDYAYNIEKLGKPIYRWEWGMTPMTINAYANFSMSEIVFPAAILQPPFFDPNADPALNYGGIGAVIGHEISHHFDDQGSKYDENGRLADWWTPSDVTAFKAATDRLVAQYDAYQPFPDAKVNGRLTLGENIGDLAGLTVAYDAYQHSLGGAEAPSIDGTTGAQRFYLGWAQVWRAKYREAAARQRLLTDSHSPSEQRVSVVRNLDPWYGAFNVQPGQKLYLAPEQRVRVW
ncbi:M13 family metallopeptidase [Sphingomonas glaciei]|uniref:M13 family metallopeptidase n=1 Tax=Sphingomonas glaciei TaxID=2938948 RepID=A0ABY5MXZ6_9SPHN|nr:M13 family metallopeptidase [Sphingomonas glaciei]UUR09007.1 M13 family metallopeptidase [Sphingomonas glaciei]